MPFDLPDPLLEQEPNFNSGAFAINRQSLIDRGLQPDQAIETLRDLWTTNRQIRHEDWTQQRDVYNQQEAQRQQQQQQQNPPAPPAPPAPHPDTPKTPDGKKGPKAGSFPKGISVSSEPTLAPSEYARQKLFKGEWVDLWYFTREGCEDAATPSTSLANDTFGITSEDSTIHLKAISTMKASNSAVPDICLTCDQISFAGKIFVHIMRTQNWPEEHAQAAVAFFLSLEIERTRHAGRFTDEAIIEYQAIVRREWFDTLGTQQAFDLGTFNKERFLAIRSRITMDKHARAVVSSFFPP